MELHALRLSLTEQDVNEILRKYLPKEAEIEDLRVQLNLPGADAATLARLMVEADLRGSDTHGVIRLPLYVRRIRAGGVNAKPNIRVVSDRPSAALIDGDNAMGHLVMRRAARLSAPASSPMIRLKP